MPQSADRKHENGMDARILAIASPDIFVSQVFGGVIIDDRGTVRVGDMDIHRDEVNHALAQTLSLMSDIADDPRNPEFNLDQIINLQDLLPWRQSVLSAVVTKLRETEGPLVAGQH